MPDLAASQRWLQRAILARGGPADADADADADAMLASTAELSGRQRLDIYRRDYRLRLLETMRGLHPGLRALLGPELFDDFALEYLDACPSRSPVLSDLDRRFAGYLAAQRPDRAEPPARRESWIGVVIDMARYERAFAAVYDGPGTEGVTRRGSAAAGNSAPAPSGGPPRMPADLDHVVTPAPCLRALRLRAPVHTYCAAVGVGGAPEPPQCRPIRLALSRRDFTVTVTELPDGPHRFLSALLAGCTARRAVRLAQVGTAEAADLLSAWTASGWFMPGGPAH